MRSTFGVILIIWAFHSRLSVLVILTTSCTPHISYCLLSVFCHVSKNCHLGFADVMFCVLRAWQMFTTPCVMMGLVQLKYQLKRNDFKQDFNCCTVQMLETTTTTKTSFMNFLWKCSSVSIYLNIFLDYCHRNVSDNT